MSDIPEEKGKKGKGKAKAGDWDLMQELRAFEVGFGDSGKHVYEVCTYLRGVMRLMRDKDGTSTCEGYG
jgi:hypothetical protein